MPSLEHPGPPDVSLGWNTQRTLLLGVGRLGDVDATDRLRYEAIFHELALKLSQVSYRILFEGTDSHPIEPIGTLVAPDPAPRYPPRRERCALLRATTRNLRNYSWLTTSLPLLTE